MTLLRRSRSGDLASGKWYLHDRWRLIVAGALAVTVLGGCSAVPAAPSSADSQTDGEASGEDHRMPEEGAGGVGTAVDGETGGQEQAGQDDQAIWPGEHQSPLVQLQRLQGENGHLHVDEVRYRAEDGKLFQCSYTFGVVDATNPASMRYEAQMLRHAIPGDERTPGCRHLAYDGNIVYTTHPGNMRNPTFLSGWDISTVDPEDEEAMLPTQIPVLQEPGVSYEGVDVADGVIYVAIRADGLGVYERDPQTNVISRIGSLPDIGNTWGVRVVDSTAYVTDIEGGLAIVDVSDPRTPTVLGRAEIDGVPKGVAVDGDTVYVAAGSAGIAVVDVSDPAAPLVIGTADTPGPALRLAYSDGHLFVAAWTDARVYDVSTPAEPRFVGSVRLTTSLTSWPDDGHSPVTARTKGIAADGDAIFVGNWWVLHSYRLYAERTAPNLLLPETVNLMDLGLTGQGEASTRSIEVTNQGTAPLHLYHMWTTNPAFTVSPRQLRVEAGETAELSVTFDGSTSDRATALLNMRSDDPLQPFRSAFLVANQEGLGIGQPLPPTTFSLVDGNEWSSEDAEGQVVVLSYFATFCPVCAEHVPELEAHFWQPFKDHGVVVVAANFHDASTEGGMEGVSDYVGRMGNTHPVGLEDVDTPTYTALTTNYKGANPFPVDVVVDREGIITYISREYDPDGLEDAVLAALADG